MVKQLQTFLRFLPSQRNITKNTFATIVALTGGLAAPLVAPLVVGLTGATFFTTAGGIALMTSLFGLTGGGLTGNTKC